MTDYLKKIPVLSQLLQYKAKNSLSNAELTAELNAFSTLNWGENTLASLFAGRMKPTNQSIDVFREFLLRKFYEANS